MKKILIIQSRTRPEMVMGEQKEYRQVLAKNAEPLFVSSLDTSIHWERPEEVVRGMDGIIIGGSGEFYLDGGKDPKDPAQTTALVIRDRLRPVIQYCVAQDIPMLGICFGHQLIGDTYKGEVRCDPLQGKTGTHEVALTEEGKNDKLFSDLPLEFPAQYGHKDSVTHLPEGAVLLASGDCCLCSALRYGTSIYTVQFHPELTASDVIEKLKNSPGYLPEGVVPETIVHESPEAYGLIPRFIELCVAQG